MKFPRLLILPCLLVFSTSATAALIDFKALADGNVYGESAYQPFSLTPFGINGFVHGRKNGSNVYAYLDRGNAGLGVCGVLEDGATLGTQGDSGTNLCDQASDDNVTTDESLLFTFNEAVTIDKIWFNNNHDSPATLDGKIIDIGTISKTFGAADRDSSRDNGGLEFLFDDSLLTFNAGDTFEIAYNNEQFYLSAININSVPEPATLAILGMGLLGLGFAARRRNI